jgi:hypothetical protein
MWQRYSQNFTVVWVNAIGKKMEANNICSNIGMVWSAFTWNSKMLSRSMCSEKGVDALPVR